MSAGFSVKVRRATLNDLDTLLTFNEQLAWETEQRRLDIPRLEFGIRSLLEDQSKGWYAVAEATSASRAATVAGQLLVTFEWSDWRNGNFWWLQSVFVHPDFRRKGIFRQLYHYVREEAKNQKDRICGFRLYVEQKNERAHQTYANFGFQETVYQMFELELP